MVAVGRSGGGGEPAGSGSRADPERRLRRERSRPPSPECRSRSGTGRAAGSERSRTVETSPASRARAPDRLPGSPRSDGPDPSARSSRRATAMASPAWAARASRISRSSSVNAAPGCRLSAYITPISRSRAWTGTQRRARIPVATTLGRSPSSASARASALTTGPPVVQDALDGAEAAAEFLGLEVLPGRSRAGRHLEVARRARQQQKAALGVRQLEHRGHHPRQQLREAHPGIEAAPHLERGRKAPQPLLFRASRPVPAAARSGRSGRRS